MRTGDLGYLDKKKNVFIKGRNKTMILGASGQNIYPEEIEDKLNNLEGVGEVEREGNSNGTMSHITAIFGFTLAGLVMKDITAS